MRRREVIALIALAGPASAQTPERVRRVGIILGLAEGDREGPARLAAFRQGLQALGWVEGRNLELAARSAGGDATREQALARELVQSVSRPCSPLPGRSWWRFSARREAC